MSVILNMLFPNLSRNFLTNIDWLLQSHGSIDRFDWFITPTFSHAFNIFSISLVWLDPVTSQWRHNITSQYHVCQLMLFFPNWCYYQLMLLFPNWCCVTGRNCSNDRALKLHITSLTDILRSNQLLKHVIITLLAKLWTICWSLKYLLKVEASAEYCPKAKLMAILHS